MKMDIVSGSHFDNYLTPNYAILPLIKYIKPKSAIWCPFDTQHSNFVRIFRQKEYEVLYTHIDDGGDFFKILNDYKDKCDYIISNPPYSKKGEVLETLFNTKKPFAMLVGVVGLFESKKRFNMFKNNEFEIMYFDKRIAFYKDSLENKPSVNPPFSTVYICNKILSKTIVFEEINKND